MNIFAPRFLGQAFLPPTLPPIAPPSGAISEVQFEKNFADAAQNKYERAKKELEALDKEGVEFDDPRYQDAVNRLNEALEDLRQMNEMLKRAVERAERIYQPLELPDVPPAPRPPVIPPPPIPPPAPWKFERTASLPATPKTPVPQTQCPTGFVVDMRSGECVPSTGPTMPTTTPGRFGINPFSGLFAGGGGMTASGFASLGWPPKPVRLAGYLGQAIPGHPGGYDFDEEVPDIQPDAPPIVQQKREECLRLQEQGREAYKEHLKKMKEGTLREQKIEELRWADESSGFERPFTECLNSLKLELRMLEPKFPLFPFPQEFTPMPAPGDLPRGEPQKPAEPPPVPTPGTPRIPELGPLPFAQVPTEPARPAFETLLTRSAAEIQTTTGEAACPPGQTRFITGGRCFPSIVASGLTADVPTTAPPVASFPSLGRFRVANMR